MKKKYVIRSDALPSKLPIWPTITLYLLYDKLQITELNWLSGGVLILLGVSWYVAISDLIRSEQKPLLDYGDEK